MVLIVARHCIVQSLHREVKMRMSCRSDTHTFLILLDDGGSSVKLRIGKADLLMASSNQLSGKDLASAILAHEAVSEGGIGVDVYNTKTGTFATLNYYDDVAKDLGTRLRCFVIRQASLGEEVLAINGRFFDYDNGMVVAGTRLEVHETPNITGAGTGLNVWDGAVLLAKYLEQKPELIRGKLVLELGAGCGLVGIVASLLQAERVTLTDLQYTLDLMRGNAAKNQAALGTIDCRLCDWLKPPIVDESWAFNVLLVADCVWIEELVPPLLNTIRRFLESLSGKIQVVVSYQQRGKRAHDLFWEGMRNLFDSIEKVDITIEKPEHLNVYECTNK